MVLVAESRVHPRSVPALLVHATVAVGLMEVNCEGKVMTICEFKTTGVGLLMKAKLTGSYCRFRINVYCAAWFI
jgi:hypothetical protein